MGLQPLEFSECVNDSPYFRDKLHTHEKELERTSKAIKALIAECKDVLNANRALSKAQRVFSQSLTKFKFDCIGSDQTDEEKVIECSLQEFGRLISCIEDERDKLLDQASTGIIQPLEMFRKEQLGAAKDGKKKFDKETHRYCTSLEKYLNLNSKQNDTSLQDADHSLEMERKRFNEESMNYVLKLQEVQEKKKFEFVEILLTFMYRLMTFYHTGHEVATDFRPYLGELQLNIQRCRANFDTTRDEAETLMNKLLSVRGPGKQEPPHVKKTCTREGYLFLKEKKALGTTWTKHYCSYQKENKILTMIPYSQVTGKGVSGKKASNQGKSEITTETMMVTSCVRRASDSIDKRFCFDLTVQDRPQTLTLQALNEEDRRLWMDAMDGKEPIYHQPAVPAEVGGLLDDIGFSFIKRLTQCLEERGLEEQGLYRVVGVGSKVNKLTNMGLDRRKMDKLDLKNEAEWETKTVTSAIKNYFRNLPEPLLTFNLYKDFIQAAKRESRTLRINEVHELVHQMPEHNFEMLDLLVFHLKRISEHSEQNLMTVGNLGVCFGPTLMRSPEESLASIMDIKWCNLVVEILIDNYDKMFKTEPQFADLPNKRVLNSSMTVIADQSSSSLSPPPASHQPMMHHSRQAMFSNHSAPPPAPSHAAPYPPGVGVGGGRPDNLSPRHQSDHPSSASSSTESLNSKCSGSSVTTTQSAEVRRAPTAPAKGHVAQAVNRFSQLPQGPVTPVNNGASNRVDTGKKVRTLYSCEAENDSELSFEPNEIILNVRPSREPGWLEGSLNGLTGLIPANYVEYIN